MSNEETPQTEEDTTELESVNTDDEETQETETIEEQSEKKSTRSSRRSSRRSKSSSDEVEVELALDYRFLPSNVIVRDMDGGDLYLVASPYMEGNRVHTISQSNLTPLDDRLIDRLSSQLPSLRNLLGD